MIQFSVTTEHVVSTGLHFNCCKGLGCNLWREICSDVKHLNTVTASGQFVYAITAQSITETYIGPSTSIQGLIHDTMHCDTFQETFFCEAHVDYTCLLLQCSASDALEINTRVANLLYLKHGTSYNPCNLRRDISIVTRIGALGI
jgi:hypothetical protein